MIQQDPRYQQTRPRTNFLPTFALKNAILVDDRTPHASRKIGWSVYQWSSLVREPCPRCGKTE